MLRSLIELPKSGSNDVFVDFADLGKYVFPEFASGECESQSVTGPCHNALG